MGRIIVKHAQLLYITDQVKSEAMCATSRIDIRFIRLTRALWSPLRLTLYLASHIRASCVAKLLEHPH